MAPKRVRDRAKGIEERLAALEEDPSNHALKHRRVSDVDGRWPEM
jgi:hypothetical protein